MAIQAIALLRIPALPTLAAEPGRVQQLDDAVLLATGAPFASEPEALVERVREQIGEALVAQHGDPRGIFFIPDVARPAARTYAGVVSEIDAGGVWGALAPAGLSSALAAGGLGALLGGLLEQMPESVLRSVGDAARGEPGSLAAAAEALQAAAASSSELTGLMGQLAEMLGPLAQNASAAGLDLSALERAVDSSGLAGLGAALEDAPLDPRSMQQLMTRLGADLSDDPAQAAKLVERLLGGEPDGGGEDE